MQTTLKQANDLVRKGQYEYAIKFYLQALEEAPELARYIEFNIQLIEKRRKLFVHPTYAEARSSAVSTVGRKKELERPHDLKAHVFEQILSSNLFNVTWYLSAYGDLLCPNENPLEHYLKHGVELGLNPSQGFDTRYYLESNSDVAKAGANPFIHYVLDGRHENRRTIPDDPHEDDAFGYIDNQNSSDELEWPRENWLELERILSRVDGFPEVAVVIPVYRDRRMTLRCLVSVLTAPCKTPFLILVIDDASPEPELSSDLDELAHRGWIKLLRNEHNLGFVKTANRGMLSAGSLDVILLNSDTEVYPSWVDRLRRAAYHDPQIASVTPLSNNATIASYPRFLSDNTDLLEVDYSTLDRLAAETNAGITVDVPTGVGFCMYMRRDAIGEVGYFDEVTFGRGYGEENDWCQRAQLKGWRNLITTDTFVRHFGSASFQGEKTERVEAAMQLIVDKHADYHSKVQAFIRENPLHNYFQRLDWARVKHQVRDENLLIVCHVRGGGTERHVREDAQRYLKEGKGVFYLTPAPRKLNHVRITHPYCRTLPNIPTFNLNDVASLAEKLRGFSITHIHVHSLVDMGDRAAELIPELARSLDVPLITEIHDYHVICPRINLADEQGFYCGEPDETGCNACLEKRGNEFDISDIRFWREKHHHFLRATSLRYVPNEDVAQRLTRYFPNIRFKVEPHEQVDCKELKQQRARQPNEIYRIVLIGSISKIKGYDLLLECAKQIQRNKIQIRFILLGHSMDDAKLESAGVIITGRYKEGEVITRLHELEPNIVWLPSTVPETYSYTLSVALRGGYPAYVFDIGAPAARLKRLGRPDWILPLEWAREPKRIVHFFSDLQEDS